MAAGLLSAFLLRKFLIDNIANKLITYNTDKKTTIAINE